MTPIVLFRKDLDTEGELAVCRKHFRPATVEYRSQVPPKSLVIPRYSALPFYGELERELALNGSRLINTHEQHQWIADCMQWAGPGGALEGLTPQTWDNWSRLPAPGSYVLKGRTNSKKSRWSSHMFAASTGSVPMIAQRLLEDSLIREQGIVVRKYVPLKKLGEGLNEQPIVNEWRTFWLAHNRRVSCLGHGFYWKGSHPELEAAAFFPPTAMVRAAGAAMRVADHATFFAIDVAETAEGNWIVIEVNDGSQSGLCGVDAEAFYSRLADEISPSEAARVDDLAARLAAAPEPDRSWMLMALDHLARYKPVSGGHTDCWLAGWMHAAEGKPRLPEEVLSLRLMAHLEGFDAYKSAVHELGS